MGVRGWCALWALVAVCLAFAWQSAVVRLIYCGNWTAVFYTGTHFGIQDALAAENIYQFPGAGWDGQYYHLIAHDPLIRGDLWKSIDAPRLRYRRILLPGLAYALAGGESTRIDWAYRAAILGFAGLGTYWLSRLAVMRGLPAVIGLAFLLMPAALCSMERMAVDIALTAILTGLVLLWEEKREGWPVYLLLALAALARETGLLLIAGWCGWLLWKRRWAETAVYATAAAPALGWYLYVRARTAPFAFHSVVSMPFTGWADRAIHPMPYRLGSPASELLMATDYLALAAILAAVLLVFRAFRQSGITPTTVLMAAFTLLMVVGWYPGDWLEAYDYSRIATPLLLLLSLRWMDDRDWRWLLPITLVLPRLFLQMAGPWSHLITGVRC